MKTDLKYGKSFVKSFIKSYECNAQKVFQKAYLNSEKLLLLVCIGDALTFYRFWVKSCYNLVKLAKYLLKVRICLIQMCMTINIMCMILKLIIMYPINCTNHDCIHVLTNRWNYECVILGKTKLAKCSIIKILSKSLTGLGRFRRVKEGQKFIHVKDKVTGAFLKLYVIYMQLTLLTN